jgi:hypothetical protein
MAQDESMDQYVTSLQGKKRMLYSTFQHQPLEKVEPNIQHFQLNLWKGLSQI